jgi:TonB family protein
LHQSLYWKIYRLENIALRLLKVALNEEPKNLKLIVILRTKKMSFLSIFILWNDSSIKIKNVGQQSELIKNRTESEEEVKSNTENVLHSVTVNIVIDEDGNVISAKAVKGDGDYAFNAVKAARQSKFEPTMLAGMPVKVTGDIVYNFTK